LGTCGYNVPLEITYGVKPPSINVGNGDPKPVLDIDDELDRIKTHSDLRESALYLASH
jgi:hypothetical protein